MKNMIIALMAAYIFYGFCVIRNPIIPVIAFVLFWVIIAEAEELVKDFRDSVKRGERLNRRINRVKGVRF
jgi:hypothetical protein